MLTQTAAAGGVLNVAGRAHCPPQVLNLLALLVIYGTKVPILTQKGRVRLRFLKDMCKMLAKAQNFESEWEKIDGKLQARARSKVSVFVLLY